MTFPPMIKPASRFVYGSPPSNRIFLALGLGRLFLLAHSRGALAKVDWPSHPRAVGGYVQSGHKFQGIHRMPESVPSDDRSPGRPLEPA